MSETDYTLGLSLTKLRSDVAQAKAEFRSIGDSSIAESKRMMESFNSVGTTITRTIAGALSVAALTSFGKQLIEVTGQFQTFRAVLNNTLGDPIAAGNAMEMIQDFATTTPFQVDALTGSFVKLANQGFTPTYEQMTLLGDLASSTGKGFDQLTEAIIDAQTGEFERLKEFGIRASKEGDNVTFTFKEQQTQVDFTTSSIRDYILSLGELEGVQGANAAIAATLTGQVSNLQDGITQMMNKIGQSSEGALSGAISSAAYLVDHYEEVGRILGVLITSYGTYKAAIIAYTAVQKAANVAGSVKAFVQLTSAIKSAKDAQLLLNMAVGANPYIKLVSILMTVGGLIWAFAKNSKSAADEVTGLEKATSEATKSFNEQAGKIKALQTIITDRNAGYYARNKAISELKALGVEYNGVLSKEGAITGDNIEVIDEYLVALEKKIRLQAYESELSAAMKRKLDAEDEAETAETNLYNKQQGGNPYAGQMKNAYKVQLTKLEDAVTSAREKIAVEEAEISKLMGKIKESASDDGGGSNTVKTYAEQVEAVAQSITDLKTKLAGLKDGTTKSNDYATDIVSTQKELTEAEARYNLLLGIDTKYQKQIADDKAKMVETLRKADLEVLANEEESYAKQRDAQNKAAFDKAKAEDEANQRRLDSLKTFAEKYKALEEEHTRNLGIISEKDGAQADVDAENQDYESKLKSLNDEVLATIGDFESLGIEATDKVIDQMIAKLQTAKSKLVEDDADPTKIAAVNAEIERCIKLKEQNNDTSQSRSLKEWQDMEKQLNDCTDSFEQMGEAIGGVAGEVISTAGGIVSSTVSMVSSIAQLVDISINGTKAAAEGASTAIRAVESASVILAVISAVIQVATKIANLFSANKQAEEDHQKALLEITERNIDAQTQYNALLREEAVLLAELNTIFGDDPYSAAIAGTERYSEAIQELRSAIKGSISDDELRSAKFIDLLTGGRANATQNLLKSYQSGTKGLSDIKIVTGSHTEKTGFLNLGKKQVDDYSSITSVYSDLVDQYGNLNTERAQTIVDTQKMSDEDKERLESMIALQEEADEAIQSINDYYSDIFGDMGSSLKDSLVDAFRNGTDAGEEFCKSMVSMLEQLGEDFAYSMSIGQVMADQQAKVDAINRDSTLTDQERAEKMMALAIETGEKAAAQQDDFNAFLEAYQQGAAKEGYNLWEADEERQASSKGIATASQESVDENNGRLTAIQGHTYGIFESMKVSETNQSAIRSSVDLLYQHTGKMLEHLAGIEDNTEYCRRLDGMDTDLSEMRKSMNRIDRGIGSLNKGITLKR